MRYAMAAVAWLLLVATAAAQQLNTLNVPSEVEVGSKIVATCNCVVPEGGRLDMLWNAPGLETVQAGNQLYIWGKPGTYSIDVVVVPLKTLEIAGQEITTIAGQILRLDARFTITGSIDPEPEPDPDPDPEPEPDPTDPPFPAPGLTVLVIREAGAEEGGLSPAQMAAIRSTTFIRWCQQHCHPLQRRDGGDGYALRIWDDDFTSSQLGMTVPYLADAYRAVRDGDVPPPVLAVSDGKRGEVVPLPTDLDALMEVLKKYE